VTASILVILPSATVKLITVMARPCLAAIIPVTPCTSTGYSSTARRAGASPCSAWLATALRAVGHLGGDAAWDVPVDAQHDTQVEHRDQSVKVAAAGGGEERVDHLPLAAGAAVPRHRGVLHPTPRPAGQLAGRPAAGMIEEGTIRGHLYTGGAWRDSVVHSILREEFEAQRP